MPTPISSATAYCSVGLMVRFNDLRHLQDLCGDVGKRILGTEIAAASDGATLPVATLNVADTSSAAGGAGFPASGTTPVWSSAGVQTLTYTGITATTLTGCSGGTGTLSVTDPVGPLLTNVKFLAAGNWASGKIEAACLAGDRYTVADLQALTGMSLAMLQGLTAVLWLYRLERRRVPKKELTDDEAEAFGMLEKLRAGEHIFGLQAQADAGSGFSTTQVQQSQIQALGLTTRIARRYYGQTTQTRRLAEGGW